MEIERILDLPILLSKKSFFLFGPRATGKSTLIRQQLSNSATVIDLLQFSYWRSTHGYEVDFLIGLETAVEVKASQKITARDFKGLKALEEEKVFKNYILVSQDPINTRDNNFQALYWANFLDNLWDDKFA